MGSVWLGLPGLDTRGTLAGTCLRQKTLMRANFPIDLGNATQISNSRLPELVWSGQLPNSSRLSDPTDYLLVLGGCRGVSSRHVGNAQNTVHIPSL